MRMQNDYYYRICRIMYMYIITRVYIYYIVFNIKGKYRTVLINN